MYVGITRAERSLHLSFCRARKRAGGRVDAAPSRFLKELAQDDLRWAGAPLPADEAAREKDAGIARLAVAQGRARGNGERLTLLRRGDHRVDGGLHLGVGQSCIAPPFGGMTPALPW